MNKLKNTFAMEKDLVCEYGMINLISEVKVNRMIYQFAKCMLI